MRSNTAVLAKITFTNITGGGGNNLSDLSCRTLGYDGEKGSTGVSKGKIHYTILFKIF
jgi:hypothetical protein